MAEIMDCLVNYFSPDAGETGMPRRYFSYHVVAGPGPTPDSGVASIATLAIYEPGERCDYCTAFHAVREGGPAAAIDKAIAYLDAYHQEDRLQTVRTAVRRSRCG
jgi:hypothetical protein